MAKAQVKALDNLKNIAKAGIDKIDVDAIKEKTAMAAESVSAKAAEIKDSAISTKEDIESKLFELDRMLEQSITEYNDAFTLMNDKGMKLYIERYRAIDSIALVETVVNSIVNHPKTFDKDFEEINISRNTFISACEFADRELYAARAAAGGAGAGLAAGASVAFMAPTAAMWIATTFGTASTGAAISTLSGAAATNAALAWLGGGAIAAGGQGIAGGSALLALSGPIGGAVAGATLLTSIVLFTTKKTKLNKQKNEEIEVVKNNIIAIKQMDADIDVLLKETEDVRERVAELAKECMALVGGDYSHFSVEQKQQLGALINGTKTMGALMGKTVSDN